MGPCVLDPKFRVYVEDKIFGPSQNLEFLIFVRVTIFVCNEISTVLSAQFKRSTFCPKTQGSGLDFSAQTPSLGPRVDFSLCIFFSRVIPPRFLVDL